MLNGIAYPHQVEESIINFMGARYVLYIYFSFQVGMKLKQCFQRKTVPQPQIESVSMLTKIIISSLLCHNDTMYK